MIRAIADLDLVETIRSGHVSPGRAGRHVTEAHRILVQRRGPLELVERGTKATLFGLQDRAGVMRDHRHNSLIPARTSEIPSTVDRVHPGVDEFRRIPDVVKPAGGSEPIVVEIEVTRQAFGLSSNGREVMPPSPQWLNETTSFILCSTQQIGHRANVSATVRRLPPQLMRDTPSETEPEETAPD